MPDLLREYSFGGKFVPKDARNIHRLYLNNNNNNEYIYMAQNKQSSDV